jgi:hypothetical protein
VIIKKTSIMKATSLLLAVLLASCGMSSDPNHPVQTAKDATPAETPGSSAIKADSATTSVNGPDQMVPENTGPQSDSLSSKKKKVHH